jgi:alpha-galactosidase
LASSADCPHSKTIAWSDDAIELRIDVDDGGMARLTRLAASGATRPNDAAQPNEAPADAAFPLLDVVLSGEGKAWAGSRYCESQAGGRFCYTGHEETTTGDGWHELRVDLDDPLTGLRAEVYFRVLQGRGALRSWVRLTNRGDAPVSVESVTSFLIGGLNSTTGNKPDELADLRVLWADSDWLAEGRWQRRTLRDVLPDLNRGVHGGDPRGRFGLTGNGTWSSGAHLPAGAIVNDVTGHAWAWQIEHNGGWHWQVGEGTHRARANGPGPGYGRHAPPGAVTGAYLALLGPADTEHHWRITLHPADTFTTVPVSIAVSGAGFEGAIAGLTAIRRAIRRPHDDHKNLPVVFNDYMNTLLGNPTTERLIPLIDAAASVGAEYFCIDSGWYADLDEGWWDSVGAWKPSTSRFPGGITEVLDHIRRNGMTPGLWLEPEVVGVHSPVAQQLPPDAFFQLAGRPVVENGRYHLDLRHPAAVKHLDEVVDFVVGDLGVGYLKLDYNIVVAPGPDTGGLTPGAGLLAANRAQLDWLDAALDRHPGLVIENCSSGAMRTDYALLARLQLQSTSDQQDFMRYPPIAVAAPAAIAPEQAAVWAYPQPEFTNDEIAFTLANAMLGRLYLSGHLDWMSPRQRALVAEAVAVYKRIRPDIAVSVPFWPLGLPRWTDSWLALGLRAPAATYLTVWRRDGDQPQLTLPIPHLRGEPVAVAVLYQAPAEASWNPARATLQVTLPRTPSACVLQLISA